MENVVWIQIKEEAHESCNKRKGSRKARNTRYRKENGRGVIAVPIRREEKRGDERRMAREREKRSQTGKRRREEGDQMRET
ncbi:hypothetical protein [Streptomyces flavovirens]|uniref:hypothetical protein n=1 Tax=Streptomyces flavovirens TaxID=52258 RepID=UPI0031E61F08